MALLKKSEIEAIFATWQKKNPEPKTELVAVNEYTLLVAIILSAQATDAGVNKATPSLFKIADTPEKMVQLGEAKLKQYIKTIGLFNSKARNVIAMSEKLVKEFGSKIPEDRDLLETLPGVGRKTANVWLNCTRGIPTVAVDTHVFRVSNRTGLCQTTNPLETELALLKKIPGQYLQHAHHWLILHGRYICVARKPKCWECDIVSWCKYPAKELAA